MLNSQSMTAILLLKYLRSFKKIKSHMPVVESMNGMAQNFQLKIIKLERIFQNLLIPLNKISML